MAEVTRRSRGWMALCLALFLVSVGMTALAATLGSALSRTQDDRREIRAASAEFAKSLQSFDYRNLEPAKAKLFQLVTPRLRAQYEAEFNALSQALTQSQARGAAEVARVYVGPVTKSTATTIVVTNAASVTSAGMRGSLETYLELTLLRTEGRWLVDKVTAIKAGEPAAVQPSGDRTTTTAVPRP